MEDGRLSEGHLRQSAHERGQVAQDSQSFLLKVRWLAHEYTEYAIGRYDPEVKEDFNRLKIKTTQNLLKLIIHIVQTLSLIPYIFLT